MTIDHSAPIPTNSKRTKEYSGTKEYRAWKAMKARCRENGQDHECYFDRGITVCDEWKASFFAFLAHIGMAPTPKHTVERINNDGNYEPGNVRWATRYEQAQNRRFQRSLITFNDKTQSLEEWSRETGVQSGTIARRIARGWEEGAALTTLPDKRYDSGGKSRMLTFRGKRKRLHQWAKELSIAHTTLLWRLDAGWSVEKALSTPARKKKRSTMKLRKIPLF